MPRKMLRLLRRVLVLLVVAAGALLVARAWDSQRGPPLDPWHTHVPHDWHAGRNRQGRLGRLPQGRGGGVSRGADRGRRQDRRSGADTGQSLLRGQPDLSRQLRTGLEPLLHPRARRARGRRGRPAARADRFSVQPAPHRALLSRPRFRRGGDQDAGTRHRARRLDRHRMGGLGRRDAACRPRGPPASRARRGRSISWASPTAVRWR